MPVMGRFDELRSSLFSAHAAGDYDRGLQIALRAHDEHPDERECTWYWRACMLSLLDRGAEAVAALEDGLREGVWYSPSLLDDDPDLESVRGLPGFRVVRDACEARRRQAAVTARPSCSVLAPASVPGAPRAIMAFHQRSQSARAFTRHWAPLVDEGWTLVVPESSQPFGSGSFCWDDHERAMAEARRHLEDCVRLRGLSAERMVIAGASQGARLALELGREAGLPWLCVIPGLPAGYEAGPASGRGPGVRGAFILGERDPHSIRGRSIMDALRFSGTDVREVVMPGVGHELPPDFPSVIRATLDWLIEPSSEAC
jgi:predicted esterase